MRIFYVGNCLIFLDLYLMVKNPFFPRAARFKYYVATLVTVSIINIVWKVIENFVTDEDLINKMDPGTLGMLSQQ